MPTAERAVEAVRCEDLVKVFRAATGETHALRGIDLSVSAGELTVVAGPSGSGKSSLLSILAMRDRPSAGRLSLFGRNTSGLPARVLREVRRRDVSFVPQRSSSGVLGHLTALAQLEQVRGWRGGRGLAAEEALAEVGLSDRADRRPEALSGGEQQRLAVAMALVGAPRLVIADEPTAELDHRSADRVVDTLLATAARGVAVVVSSHDERVTARAQRLLRLRHGVLSSEDAAQHDLVAMLDSTGRLQLPPHLLERFPTGRVVVEPDGDGVRLRPPRSS